MGHREQVRSTFSGRPACTVPREGSACQLCSCVPCLSLAPDVPVSHMPLAVQAMQLCARMTVPAVLTHLPVQGQWGWGL